MAKKPTGTTGKPLFLDLLTLVEFLRGDLYVRFMRRAQKQALIEWRDRSNPPGLDARFTEEGKSFYDFSRRQRPRRGKGYFIHSGALRRMMKTRQPRSLNTRKDTVVTTMKYGGGALSFLVDVRGTRSISRSHTVAAVQVRGHTRRGIGGIATIVQVKTYSQQHRIDKTVRNKASLPYSAEFARFIRDQAWIEKRTGQLFLMIVRRAVLDRRTGGVKSSMLEGLDAVGVAA